MLNIVVLDQVAFTPEQETRLRDLGNVQIFTTMPSGDADILQRLGEADICILGWTSLNEPLLKSLPRLKMVAIWATGANYVELPAAHDLGITVTNVPAYAANAVAELCIGFMIMLSRSLRTADRHVRGGDYRWQDFRGTELAGKTLGIVGLGSIGSRLCALARCLGMKVIGFTHYPSPKRAQELGIVFTETLDSLLETADYISLNCALTFGPEGTSTTLRLDDRRLGLIRPSAYLINTARAGLIDQEALVKRLRKTNGSSSFAGAALDDIDTSSAGAQELYRLDNVLLSPHLGFHTAEALTVKSEICIMNIAAYIAGNPVNIV
jgi:D-3-phosphoglycerate dehydrogenase